MFSLLFSLNLGVAMRTSSNDYFAAAIAIAIGIAITIVISLKGPKTVDPGLEIDRPKAV